MSYMARHSKLSGSLTVRLSARSLRELRVRARREKKSRSDVVREMVEQGLAPQKSLYELSKKWIGSIAIDDPRVFGANLRETMKSWNPDRRG